MVMRRLRRRILRRCPAGCPQACRQTGVARQQMPPQEVHQFPPQAYRLQAYRQQVHRPLPRQRLRRRQECLWGGAPPPSVSPPGGAFAGAEAPFVAALCSELSPGSAELERFLHVLADALVDPAVQQQCADPVGGTDLLLLADEINFHLAERAAATSPPVAAFQLRPQPHASYSVFQKALTAFRSFMRLPLVSPSPPSPSPLGGVASTLGPLPFAAPSHGGKPSSVARNCPPECKGAAANAAITLDRVAANSLLLSQLQQLDLSARTKGADALRAELAAAPHDLRAMLESDIEHVDVGAFSLAASNLWRTIYRASSKGARHVLLTNESLVSDRSQAPNPQFEAFIKNLASGSLHLITEFMLNGNSNANKHKLFTASDSILNDYAIMNDRVRIVMEGFAAKHHSQAQAAESFLVNFRKLANSRVILTCPLHSCLILSGFPSGASTLSLARKRKNRWARLCR